MSARDPSPAQQLTNNKLSANQMILHYVKELYEAGHSLHAYG